MSSFRSICWLNGHEIPREQVAISPDDAGFRFGDGLFETLRVDDGVAHDVEAHLDRLFASLPRIALDIPENRDQVAEAIACVARAAPRPLARLRVTLTRGHAGAATRLVEAFPLALPPAEALIVFLPEFRIDSLSPLAGLKSLSYQGHRLALTKAQSLGAWEALLPNERGHLCEGSRCNVALAFEGKLWTPPLFDGCLPGTVRRRLLEEEMLTERSLTSADLDRAERIYLMNSLIGLLPARLAKT